MKLFQSKLEKQQDGNENKVERFTASCVMALRNFLLSLFLLPSEKKIMFGYDCHAYCCCFHGNLTCAFVKTLINAIKTFLFLLINLLKSSCERKFYSLVPFSHT